MVYSCRFTVEKLWPDNRKRLHFCPLPTFPMPFYKKTGNNQKEKDP